MAAKSSAQITAMDATPAQRQTPRTWNAREMVCMASLEKDAADDSTNALRFFRVHSSWVPVELVVKNDAITSVTDVNIGLYDIRGGAVVNENVFADAVSVATANLGDVLDDTTGLREDYGEAIWERLGLTEDPELWYDLAITVISAATNGGTIVVIGKFMEGS